MSTTPLEVGRPRSQLPEAVHFGDVDLSSSRRRSWTARCVAALQRAAIVTFDQHAGEKRQALAASGFSCSEERI
jgi:hypothetical protein